MKAFSHRSYPRAILHIDGDSFFAACEVAKNPALRGKPVVTGKERGIVSAMTYEAKALGIKRAMPLYQIQKQFPHVVIVPSDYETYSLYSKRMYEIVRRYTPVVEEYSIDECFADLTGMCGVHRMPYQSIANHIKHTLALELGLSFSVGLAPSKVLAKVGSKWRKPNGFTPIPLRRAHLYLAKVPVGSVWGIGPNTAARLNAYDIHTALQFAEKPLQWVEDMFNKPMIELWRELRGEYVLPVVVPEEKDHQHSISKTRTFTPPSTDPSLVFSQLSKNIENACIKARRHGLVASRAFFFLKTQEFQYEGMEIDFTHATNTPTDVLALVEQKFPEVFRPRTPYRATGITLCNLAEEGSRQLDIFGAAVQAENVRHVFGSVDAIADKFGKHAVFLGSSFRAMKEARFEGARQESPARVTKLLKGETARKRLAIPLLGEVS